MEKFEHKPGKGSVWLNKDGGMPAFRAALKYTAQFKTVRRLKLLCGITKQSQARNITA